MNIESNVLQIENLSQMSFNDLLSLYRQGYKLAEQSEIGLNIGLNILNAKGNNIRSLATCPGSVQTGATLTLSASASSGAAPYTYHWSVVKPDGSTVTLANQVTNQYVVGSNGNYTISVYVTDSCVSGAKTSSTDSCMITASTSGCISTGIYNCEAGQTGYEVDNCGTRRYNSACAGGGGVACPGCDLTKNYCLAGNCIPKNYVLYAGVGLVALLVLK